jgi:transcriptional regulator with XRE-family HTH domain
MSAKRKDDRIELGRRMADLRREHGRTQQECADALGVAQPTYAEMEGGQGRIRRRDLVTLAVLYGVTLEVAFPTFSEPGQRAA